MDRDLYRQALALYRRNNFSSAAELLTGNRDHAEAMMLLGLCRAGEGNYPAAVAALDRAVELEPDNPAVRFNRGVVLQQAARRDDALADYRRVLALSPGHAGAANNAANLLKRRGCLSDAETVCREALASSPDHPQLLTTWAAIRSDMGEVSAALEVYHRAVGLAPDDLIIRSNLLLNLNYLPGANAELFREHRQWQQAFHNRRNKIEAAVFPPRNPENRIRVGYLSPDFRYHSVAYFIESVLRHHDRTRFEIHVFSDVPNPDDITRRLAALAEAQHDVSRMTIAETVACIRGRNLDILVDLAGHTGAKLEVFAWRAAPVQVAYLGYPNTTGLRHMDYRFTDDLADLVETARFYTEKQLFLPGGIWAYAPLADAPDLNPPPVLKNGFITFGSFNHQAKISDYTLSVWAEAMKACPGSRLLLKNRSLHDPEVIRLLAARLARYGIAADRLECCEFQPGHRHHLEIYRRVDIALDTFPYNGTTTTFEALWMGVPVLTLTGSCHAARVGLSIMTRIGLSSFVAGDPAELARIAARNAADSAGLAALRPILRHLLADSPLLDGIRLTREIEKQYEQIVGKGAVKKLT